MNDLYTTDTTTLCSMADTLKADAKALQCFNRAEAMRLFRLFLKITAELSRRKRLSEVLESQAYRYN